MVYLDNQILKVVIKINKLHSKVSLITGGFFYKMGNTVLLDFVLQISSLFAAYRLAHFSPELMRKKKQKEGKSSGRSTIKYVFIVCSFFSA